MTYWRQQLRAAAILLGTGMAFAGAPAAHAADEEIQVYMDEIGAVGALSLDVHMNYVTQGRTVADYRGEQASESRLRITPEWGYAITPTLEFGAYLPLTTIDRDGNFEVGGVKGRLKYVAPRPEGRDWFWGLNFEIGKVRRDLDINPWNAELKGILGVRKGPWTLAANYNFGWVVSGPDQGSNDMSLATKIGYSLDDKTSIGIESYNGLGSTKAIGPFSTQDHVTYLVIDKTFGDWELNFGVGRGYGQPEDDWVIKAVIGVPLGH